MTYPIARSAPTADSLNAFAPDVQIGSARSWTMGFQRAITRDMAVDVRYVGTRGVDQWSTLNYNTRDIESNGFLNEFKLAVANLKANNEAGGTAGQLRVLRAGHGHQPAADLHGVPARSDRQRESRPPTPARSGRTRVSRGTWSS